MTFPFVRRSKYEQLREKIEFITRFNLEVQHTSEGFYRALEARHKDTLKQLAEAIQAKQAAEDRARKAEEQLLRERDHTAAVLSRQMEPGGFLYAPLCPFRLHKEHDAYTRRNNYQIVIEPLTLRFCIDLETIENYSRVVPQFTAAVAKALARTASEFVEAEASKFLNKEIK